MRRWPVLLALLGAVLVGAPALAQNEPAPSPTPSGGAAGIAPAAGAPAGIAPVAAAWFDAGRPTAGPGAPPPPPDVGPDQLLVEGVTLSTALLPVPPAQSAAQVIDRAVVALAFRIPAGTSPASLTLDLVPGTSTAQLVGTGPTGVTPEACPATGEFVSGGQQPFDAVPAYDCTGRTSRGSLNAEGTQVVFSDIGGLAQGGLLTFVVRPGTTGPDRLVFAAPSVTTLTLLAFDSAPVFDPVGLDPALPPSLDSTPATPPELGTSPPWSMPTSTVPDGLGAVPSVAVPAAGPVVDTSLNPPASRPPVALTPVALTPAALAVPDDGPARAAALAGLVLLAALVGLLVGTDRDSTLLGTDRVLHALRNGAPVPDRQAPQWGYGRYRSARTGRAPGL